MQLKWRISHVRGYLELGMFDAAEAELQLVPRSEQENAEVIALRVALLHEQKSWEKLRLLAEDLVSKTPEVAEWWISWAYAARRSQNLMAADMILRKAEQFHPENATIHFNLGCYACQLGNLIAARSRVARAIQLDAHYQELAKTDPDLAPLRNDDGFLA